MFVYWSSPLAVQLDLCGCLEISLKSTVWFTTRPSDVALKL